MTTIWITLLMSFAILLLVIAGMSIGVLNGRKPLSGSCGGLGNGGGCSICGRTSPDETCTKARGKRE
jgi:hypothetical protein